MRTALVCLVLSVGVGCIEPVSEERDAGSTIDSEDAGTNDAGFDAGTDAGVTWDNTVQPLLQRCATCHSRHGGQSPWFPASYEVMKQPATICSGTMAECVVIVLRMQRVEGMGCRTYARPFHREGWDCLTDEQIDTIVTWVDAGMPE